jgi:hypothetical protein
MVALALLLVVLRRALLIVLAGLLLVLAALGVWRVAALWVGRLLVLAVARLRGRGAVKVRLRWRGAVVRGLWAAEALAGRRILAMRLLGLVEVVAGHVGVEIRFR